jgi:hypothetical protein
LISEAPFNGLLFPFEWNKAITCMYLKCIVTPKQKPNGEPHEGFTINGITLMPRECGWTSVRTFCGAMNNVQRKLITDMRNGSVKKVRIYMPISMYMSTCVYIVTYIFIYILYKVQDIPEARELIDMVAPRGQLSKAAEGASSFIAHIATPLIRTAIFTSDRFDGMQKAQFWSMTAESLHHILRPGEVTNNCRRVDDLAKVGMPKNAKGFLSCGFPMYLVLTFRSFKTERQGNENDCFTYHMKLFHNSTNIEMDPVTALTHYIAVSGLDINNAGPIVSLYYVYTIE